MKKRSVFLSILLCLLFAASACGGREGPPAPKPPLLKGGAPKGRGDFVYRKSVGRDDSLYIAASAVVGIALMF